MGSSVQPGLYHGEVRGHPRWLKVLRPFVKFAQHVLTAGRTTREPKVCFKESALEHKEKQTQRRTGKREFRSDRSPANQNVSS